MAVIWKYQLPITDVVRLHMPRFANPLAVAEQYGGLQLWALVDPDQEKVEMRFHVVGTGNPAEADNVKPGYYIGTAVMKNGLVWHVFGDGV